MKQRLKNLSFGLLSFALSVVMLASGGILSIAATTAGKLEEPVGGNYFVSDYENRAELTAAGEQLQNEIRKEGAVMLKNTSEALPLQEGSKISIFGKAQTVSAVCRTTRYQSAGFQFNKALSSFYWDNNRSGAGRPTYSGGNTVRAGFATGETPISMFDEPVLNSFEEYDDAAIVYFFRATGEGADAPRTMMWNGTSYGAWDETCTELVPGARNKDDHYLQLDQNETELLHYVCENFEKVVVVLNSTTQMETGFLDDPNHYAYHENIDAAFWVRQDCAYETDPIPLILKGEISPSGRTTDTWMRDFKLDPTWQNFGNNLVLDGNRYENLANGSDFINRYVIYQEGIYVGYRYWETRGYLEGTQAYTSPSSGDFAFHGTTTTQWDNWYDAHVVFPFGYGLSYTTFDWEVVEQTPAADSALDKDGSISVQVQVTNTGTVAGKDVVQLYYTASYEDGGIEKAHVVLGAFEKTDLIQPGESDTVTLTMKVRDMASYDWNDANNNGYKGYELESGNYIIRLMRNAHEEETQISYNVGADIKYETSETTGETIENRFDEVSNYLINDVQDQYMSRSDFAGTFPSIKLNLTAPQWVIDGLKEWDVSTRPANADESQPYYTTEMPTTGATNGIKLKDLIGKDYDDSMWTQFLDQLTYDQLVKLATDGNYHSGLSIPELGITREPNSDGVGGLAYYKGHHETENGTATNTWWGAQASLAATWNKELAYRKGRIIGNEGLWGGSKDYSQLPGYYAPGVNIHRSPFSGRNPQYFSEDGFFTGIMAAQIVKGANDMGMFTYVKHFGLNDQETNRIGVLTWANEQSMREIYFKGFEICVKEGKTTAIMSGLNRIGTTWAGGNYQLLTEVLRNEWGFNGCVVTDSYINNFSNADQMIRAGGNLALGNATLKYNVNTPTTVSVLREAAHGLLYTHANSMAVNEGARPIVPESLSAYTGEVLRTGSLGVAYTASVATAEISADYPELTQEDVTYALADDSQPLPDGLSLSSDGTITGTPIELVENYNIIVTATCQAYTRSTTFTLNVTLGEPEIIWKAKSSALTSARLKQAYTISVAEAEIFAPGLTPEEQEMLPTITYSLGKGSVLPAGLSLSSDGTITGTPTAIYKNRSFSVVAKANGMQSKTMTYTISVLADMTFGVKELKLAQFGVNYLDRVQLAECNYEVTYQLKNGSTLPNGLTLTSSGYISGKPTQTVTDHKFTVQAISEFSETVEVEYKISVGIKFDGNMKLPDAEAGKNYSTRIDTAQGAGTVKYTVKDGSALPAGLTLSEDGKISGKPTKAGVYEVTFVANAEGKVSDEITLTLYVAGKIANDVTPIVVGSSIGGVALVGIGVAAFFVLKKRKM